MADFLDEKRKEIQARLKELRPLHEEFLKLERAKLALAGMDAPRRRGPGRPRGSATPTTPRRRRRRGGTRADQAVKIIADNPGITASEVAKQMRIKPNYLYRVLGDLQKEGRVKKSGRSYSVAA